MKKLICAALVLLLVSSCALAESFSIRDGITWSTTLEELTLLFPDTEPEETDFSNLQQYFFSNVSVAGTTGDFMASYLGDRLLMVGYIFENADRSALSAALSEKYASAADCTKESFLELVNTVNGLSGAEEYDISSLDNYEISCWAAAENTAIYLLTVDGDTIIEYFNMNAIEELSAAPVYTTDGL